MSEWANHYISDIRAERDALRAKVARVEALADELVYVGLALRDALGIDQGHTESEPAVTTRHEATQGAGDGV